MAKVRPINSIVVLILIAASAYIASLSYATHAHLYASFNESSSWGGVRATKHFEGTGAGTHAMPPSRFTRSKEEKAVGLAISRTFAFAARFENTTIELQEVNAKKSEVQDLKLNMHHYFPRLGTREFSQLCSWAVPTKPIGNCTLVAQLSEKSNEGTSDWASKVVQAHLLALQANCQIRIQYHPGSATSSENVDLSKIFIPNSPTINWEVPNDFKCREEDLCFQPLSMYESLQSGPLFGRIQSAVHPLLLGQVPIYRFLYNAVNGKLSNSGNYTILLSNLPEFEWTTGMACSLEALLQLSPGASQFEPRLFTELLPALRNRKHLVIALYIRTHRADVVARKEERSGLIEDEAQNSFGDRSESDLQNVAKCAKKIEQEYLNKAKGTGYTKVIWMVVSDSPLMKERVAAEFHGRNVSLQPSSEAITISRQVLATSSKGRHTRPKRSPTTADVAEAMIDWYLIGESNVVVEMASVSFGQTASLRTARPIYNGYRCQKLDIRRG